MSVLAVLLAAFKAWVIESEGRLKQDLIELVTVAIERSTGSTADSAAEDVGTQARQTAGTSPLRQHTAFSRPRRRVNRHTKGAQFMLDLNQILGYIDEYYRAIASRPRMYIGHPEAYENVVIAIEQLRDETLILKRGMGTYQSYLESHGFGSADFTFRYKESHGGSIVDSDDFYKSYSLFLMTYIDSSRKSVK